MCEGPPSQLGEAGSSWRACVCACVCSCMLLLTQSLTAHPRGRRRRVQMRRPIHAAGLRMIRVFLPRVERQEQKDNMKYMSLSFTPVRSNFSSFPIPPLCVSADTHDPKHEIRVPRCTGLCDRVKMTPCFAVTLQTESVSCCD